MYGSICPLQAQPATATRTQSLRVCVVKATADKGLLNYLHHKSWLHIHEVM